MRCNSGCTERIPEQISDNPTAQELLDLHDSLDATPIDGTDPGHTRCSFGAYAIGAEVQAYCMECNFGSNITVPIERHQRNQLRD